MNFNVNLGWSGSYYNRYDRFGRCDDRVVIVDRPCPPPVIVAPCPPPVVLTPCPPPVVYVPPPCPPRTVIVEKPCPPTVIVREPAPTVIVRNADYSYPSAPLVRERADEQFRAGRLAIAADLYREHLRSNPTDDYARRALGYALLEDNKFEDAIGVIASAYDSSPVLGRSSVALGSLPDGGSCLGARLQEVKAIADRSNSWQAYVTAAVIAQSIGSYDLAASLTDRARSCGLNEKSALELSLAVTSVGR